LGRPGGCRRRVYDRLLAHAGALRGTLFATAELDRAIEELYRFPLTDHARDALNRQLRSSIGDEDLVALVLSLRRDGRLCQVHDENVRRERQIICSLGLTQQTAR